ncbi:Exodeoxyribonuclease III [Carbonactinospora thermoautotrophica]|uniref:Exodeoxyribonuclease III n=2 Tax=Carbonactinospora thermoautotrophica TaxID=1469144 RepID=A0A132MYK6_9ACTN|nr:Exodeoxyribonuclease III [Carbonactinospora thermoautotrophica]
MQMFSILTVNIGAASRERAEVMLRWLAARPEDVFILTETSAGAGTTYLLDKFRQAGFAVVHTPDATGDRGTALVSRVSVTDTLSGHFAGVSIPGRVASALLATEPAVAVLGVYVPSRDRSVEKTEKKQAFINSLLARLDALPDELRERLVLGGDYNVIARTHQPLHPGFLAFEFGLLEAIEAHGFVDAHERCSPGEQVYSWIGRTGDGYRYDYFHVGQALGAHIMGCAYLQETREQRLTDHAAVTLQLDVTVQSRLETSDPADTTEADAMTLF